MFPHVNKERFSGMEALKIILQRFAYRNVLFDVAMAKSFYKLPEKEIRMAVRELAAEKILEESNGVTCSGQMRSF